MLSQAEIIEELSQIKTQLANLSWKVFMMAENLPENEQTLELGEKSIGEIFSTLRSVWKIPAELAREFSLKDMQKKMSEGLADNWASRELLDMREE